MYTVVLNNIRFKFIWKGRDMVRDHKIIGIESNNQVLNYGIEIKYKNRKTYRKRDKRNKKL